MEAIIPVNDIDVLASSLKKHFFQVYRIEDNVVFESKHRKPNFWIFYLILGVGVIRMFAQDISKGLIGVGFGVTGLIVLSFSKKLYDSIASEFKKVAVSQYGIAFTYRNNKKVQLSPEEIDSFHIDIQYDKNNVLGYVSIKDMNGNWYNPFIIMHKSEDHVNEVSNMIIKAIQNTLRLK